MLISSFFCLHPQPDDKLHGDAPDQLGQLLLGLLAGDNHQAQSGIVKFIALKSTLFKNAVANYVL